MTIGPYHPTYIQNYEESLVRFNQYLKEFIQGNDVKVDLLCTQMFSQNGTAKRDGRQNGTMVKSMSF